MTDSKFITITNKRTVAQNGRYVTEFTAEILGQHNVEDSVGGMNASTAKCVKKVQTYC